MKSTLTLNDYYPAPFWFINHKLEKKEISRQLRLMKEQHVNSFFIHPRAGLLTPYGSVEFFDMVRYIVEEAEALDMKAWLYDEDPYPSGQAGGRIIMDNPEFAARELTFKEFIPDENGHICEDIGNGRLLEAMAVRLDNDENIIETKNVFDDVGVLRKDFFQSEWHNSYYAQLTGRVDYFHYRAETYYPRLAIDITVGTEWRVYVTFAQTVKTSSKYDFLPDNLNPECVQEFIKLTHEKYNAALGDKFGSVIPGIFTDETATGGNFAWTPKFEKEFKKRRSVNINGSYFRIFRGKTDEDRKVREAYWRTVQELFIESFYKPVNDWCKEHSLQLCGHGIGEEDPLATTNGMNIFALQKYVGIPGFDHITPNIPDGRKVKSLNLGGRLVASSAAQNGESRVQSECFACNAYNFGHDGLRKNANWLFSLGITWLVPHGFHYSYDGYRKDDAGKSFFFQDAEYENFHKFADYTARTGSKLGEAKSMASVCILYPVSVFRSLVPAENEQALKLREKLYDCVQFMFDNHIQFELADDDTLATAPIKAGKVQCGKCSYSTIALPFKELDKKSLELLSNFQESGVEVIYYPEQSNALIGRDGFSIKSLNCDAAADSLMTLLKSTENGKLLYIFSNQKQSAFFSLKTGLNPDGGVYIYDADKDIYLKVQPDGNTYNFDIDGYAARIIEFRDKPITGAKDYKMPAAPSPAFTAPYEEKPQWDYIPPISGLKACISNWDISINNKSYGQKRYTLIRDLAGTNLKYLSDRSTRPHFDIAPLLATPYPAQVEFKAEFALASMTDACKLVLLAEHDTFAGDCSIYLNDIQISLKSFKRVLRYDPWNIEADISSACKSGINTLRITWDKGNEFDGLRSLIYITNINHIHSEIKK